MLWWFRVVEFLIPIIFIAVVAGCLVAAPGINLNIIKPLVLKPSLSMIDTLAWIHIQDKHILSTKSFGKDKYYIPGGKRAPGETDGI